ncbi:collagenase-like [Hyposmocoma kahamanoa]|uniref:collagenase-like n=1 Tax=Hyposmocoma kahamanoa TaxID=1477025 RepID=UPI000E6D8D64|nr:collagenase-like [Hyposmocoma kahamanoa]
MAMALLGIFIITALVASTISAEDVATFPEVIRERSASRIVSGWEAKEGQFPYQMLLRMVNNIGTVNSCGATIIHAEWGLTAAHCTAGRHTFLLRAGGINVTRPEIMFETREFYNHPLYNNNLPGVVQPNDVGLLKFGRVLTFSDRVQPVRLQASRDMNRNYDGVRLLATGWGRVWTDAGTPEIMNWVYLRGTTNEFCRQQYGGSSIIADSTICGRYYNVTSQSVCHGDSGGGLTVVDDDGEISQVGISSFVSSQGCHVIIPAGFARPGHYHSWYTEVTGINFDWELEDGSGSEENGIGSDEVDSAQDEDENSALEDKSSSEEEENFFKLLVHGLW